MLEQLAKRALRVVGFKQVLKAMAEERLTEVVVAMDAAPQMVEKLSSCAAERRVALTQVPTMAELGKLCRVDVPSAAAGILAETDDKS